MRTTPIITATLMAALLAGCGATPGTTEHPADDARQPRASAPATTATSPRPTDGVKSAAASDQDPVQVGKTFVEAAYRWDTRTNTDLTAALKRVDYMATDGLAPQFVAPQNAAGGAAWNKAARHQAHTEPEVSIVPEGNQALVKSSPETKKAGYMVEWDWHGAGAYRQDGGKDLIILTLTKTDNGWKVASFEPTPLQ